MAGRTRVLLQIFSKTVIGPIFFEFIQRKGDDGFGEGNFKALFEFDRGGPDPPRRAQGLLSRRRERLAHRHRLATALLALVAPTRRISRRARRRLWPCGYTTGRAGVERRKLLRVKLPGTVSAAAA